MLRFSHNQGHHVHRAHVIVQVLQVLQVLQVPGFRGAGVPRFWFFGSGVPGFRGSGSSVLVLRFLVLRFLVLRFSGSLVLWCAVRGEKLGARAGLA